MTLSPDIPFSLASLSDRRSKLKVEGSEMVVYPLIKSVWLTTTVCSTVGNTRLA
jgi:hypothetical protein